MRYAQVIGGVVANVIEEADAEKVPTGWIAIKEAPVGPGFIYDGERFTPPDTLRQELLKQLEAVDRLGDTPRARREALAGDNSYVLSCNVLAITLREQLSKL